MRIESTCTIEDLYAEAYASAITNVIKELNKAFGTKLSYRNDWSVVEEISDTLGIRFDVNGEIVK